MFAVFGAILEQAQKLKGGVDTGGIMIDGNNIFVSDLLAPVVMLPDMFMYVFKSS
jgi:hypothetical protein